MSNRRMQNEECPWLWRLVMAAYEASSMAVAGFCRQDGLHHLPLTAGADAVVKFDLHEGIERVTD